MSLDRLNKKRAADCVINMNKSRYDKKLRSNRVDNMNDSRYDNFLRSNRVSGMNDMRHSDKLKSDQVENMGKSSKKQRDIDREAQRPAVRIQAKRFIKKDELRRLSLASTTWFNISQTLAQLKDDKCESAYKNITTTRDTMEVFTSKSSEVTAYFTVIKYTETVVGVLFYGNPWPFTCKNVEGMGNYISATDLMACKERVKTTSKFYFS